MVFFLIAYCLCGTHSAHTNCRPQIPPLRFGIAVLFLRIFYDELREKNGVVPLQLLIDSCSERRREPTD